MHMRGLLVSPGWGTGVYLQCLHEDRNQGCESSTGSRTLGWRSRSKSQESEQEPGAKEQPGDTEASDKLPEITHSRLAFIGKLDVISDVPSGEVCRLGVVWELLIVELCRLGVVGNFSELRSAGWISLGVGGSQCWGILTMSWVGVVGRWCEVSGMPGQEGDSGKVPGFGPQLQWAPDTFYLKLQVHIIVLCWLVLVRLGLDYRQAIQATAWLNEV